MMNSVFNIRKRRSKRLLNVGSPCKIGCLNTQPLGDFVSFPLEIRQMIYSRTSVLDLSNMALASKALCDSIEEYRMTSDGKKKFLLDVDVHSTENTASHSSMIHAYFELGTYMKRTSFLKATPKRLKQIKEYVGEHLICKPKCGDVRTCVSFYCYGTFLHSMIAGWDDLECLRVVEYVHQHSPIPKFISQIFSSLPGSMPQQEMYVRCFYRRIFHDVLRKTEDKAHWLNVILKPFPIINRAKLLQILFLPKDQGGIDFAAAVEARWQVTSLSHLGSVISSLYHHSLWSDDDVMSVIDEIVALPSMWNYHNLASLLYHCDEEITLRVLTSKSINNRLDEIICIAHHLLVVSVMASQSIDRASRCIWQLMKQMDIDKRKHIATELLRKFKESVMGVFGAPGLVQELEALLEAAQQFTQEILGLALDALSNNKLPHAQFTKLNHQSNDLSENFPLLESEE